MTEFVSEVKTIPFNEDRIFNMLSDLSNLGKVQAAYLKIRFKISSSIKTLAVFPSHR